MLKDNVPLGSDMHAKHMIVTWTGKATRSILIIALSTLSSRTMGNEYLYPPGSPCLVGSTCASGQCVANKCAIPVDGGGAGGNGGGGVTPPQKPPGQCSIEEKTVLDSCKMNCNNTKYQEIMRLNESLRTLKAARDKFVASKGQVQYQLDIMNEMPSTTKLIVKNVGYTALAIADVVPAKKIYQGTKGVCTGAKFATQAVCGGASDFKTGVLYVNKVNGGNVAASIGEKAFSIAAKNASKAEWSWISWIPIIGTAVDANASIKADVYDRDKLLKALGDERGRLGWAILHVEREIKRTENDIKAVQSKCP
jgi:hypothetical protein